MIWGVFTAISHLRCAHKRSWRLARCLNSLSAHKGPVSGPYRKHPRRGWGAEVLWAVVPKDFSHPAALPWRVPSSHRLPWVHLPRVFLLPPVGFPLLRPLRLGFRCLLSCKARLKCKFLLLSRRFASLTHSGLSAAALLLWNVADMLKN